MKVKLETLPQGVFVCHVLEKLTREEADQVIQGIIKVLSNGKARVILEFVNASVQGNGGANYIEKGLRHHRDLARKMGGDLKYVIPDPTGSTISDVLFKYEDAVKAFLGHTEEVIKDNQNYQVQNAQLKKENLLLLRRIEDLSSQVQQPSTDLDLKAALEHYQMLAAEAEMKKPSSGAASPKNK